MDLRREEDISTEQLGILGGHSDSWLDYRAV
jgi:hypothetical protein